ncbi:hypothetical protein PAXRUDRAFT_830308 [Paxillus rubicundulus Ve08.2h10]|uniref:Xylosidase/arabinosidase n=1 Tax=Paxillus rubicundulus Ve08.2h10 TaxID=930991 RepID=A0A0D0E4C4_9AGAM|nr:hypothetical protein PAXRUDRAFT_830308 [Paxillus rubicundulus Ve08.2h10]
MLKPGLEQQTLKRANPKTIQDKFLVGYQGWFTCAGDGKPVGEGHHGWLHWFNAPIPNGGHPNIDLWPDVSEYSPSELYPAPGLKTANDEQVFLFSSRHQKTVRRHFHWMALHGVDGAFLQRFAGECDLEAGSGGIRTIRDEVGDRVKEAAEAEGRVYAIMYDVSGVSPDKIQRILEEDWKHLLHDQHLVDSPNYLRENGKPVVALWGLGFNGRNHTPDLVRSITKTFRSITPAGVYLVAGVPGHWRTSVSDADRNPEFVRVWTECFDALSPWTVGRYVNEEQADNWGEQFVKADAQYLKKLEEDGGRKVDYIPVVLPGGSGYNLSGGKWGRNDIKRNQGRFLWKQIYNARRAGVRTIYGAMWDEYDEGTALMPVVSSTSQLPVHPAYKFLALDADGYDLPSDWYMRVVGFAAEGFHGERTLLETFPIKELQDYWETRPHYEELDAGKVQQRLTEEAGNAFRAWEAAAAGQGAIDEVPPPPYTEEEIQQEEVRQQQVQGARAPLGQSSGGGPNLWPQLSQDPGPAPPLPARRSSLAVSGSAASSSSASLGRSQSARPPAVDMSSHPSQSVRQSTKPQYPPEKVEVVMAPPAVPPRRQSSPSGPNTSVSISSLADDFARQNISTSPPWPSIENTYQAGPATSYSSNITVGVPSSSSPPIELGHEGGWRPPLDSPRPSLLGGTHSPPWQPVHAPSQYIFYSPSQIPSHLPQPLPQCLRPGSLPPSPPTRPQDVIAFPGVTHYGPPEGGLGWTGGSGSGTQGFPSPGRVSHSSSYTPQGQPQEAYPHYFYNQTTTGGPQPQGMGPYPPDGYGHDHSHTLHSHSPPPTMVQGGMSPPPSIPPRPPMHPQSSSYYASSPSASFGGGGRNAWDTVEGIAGKDARRQLEKKMKSLTQTGTTLLNKLK